MCRILIFPGGRNKRHRQTEFKKHRTERNRRIKMEKLHVDIKALESMHRLGIFWRRRFWEYKVKSQNFR